MLCRLSRQPLLHGVSKSVRMCPKAWLTVATRFVAGRQPDSSQAILPARTLAPACFVTTHTKKRGAPALLLHATDNRANSLDGGR